MSTSTPLNSSSSDTRGQQRTSSSSLQTPSTGNRSRSDSSRSSKPGSPVGLRRTPRTSSSSVAQSDTGASHNDISDGDVVTHRGLLASDSDDTGDGVCIYNSYTESHYMKIMPLYFSLNIWKLEFSLGISHQVTRYLKFSFPHFEILCAI